MRMAKRGRVRDLSSPELTTIRFTGGGIWDGREIKKEYTPKFFRFYETVHMECVTREYVQCGVLNAGGAFSEQVQLYKLVRLKDEESR